MLRILTWLKGLRGPIGIIFLFIFSVLKMAFQIVRFFFRMTLLFLMFLLLFVLAF